MDGEGFVFVPSPPIKNIVTLNNSMNKMVASKQNGSIQKPVVKQFVAPKNMFASEKIKRFEIGNDQWLDIREGISAAEVMSDPTDATEDKVKKSFDLLKKVIADWRLLDENGAEVDYSPDALSKLNMPAMMFLMQECNRAIGLGETAEEEGKE